MRPTESVTPPPTHDYDELPRHLQTLGAGIDFTDPNSPLAPYYLQTSDVVAAVLLAVVFAILSHVPLWHTDIWGHLKYGQWIAAHHRLPDKDVLCRFADPDAKALDAYWLGQTGFYLAYHVGEVLAGGDEVRRMEGGVELLRGLHAALAIGTWLLLFFAMRRRGCPPAAARGGLFLIFLLSLTYQGIMRPQVLGEFFFAAVLCAVSRPVLSRRALVLLPLVLVLWANCHGSFVLGLTLLGGCLLGELLRVAVARRTWQPRLLFREPQLQRLALALAACALAVALFNPHGPFIYSITWDMGHHPNVLAMDEWQPLSFARPTAATYLYLATLVLLVVTQLLSRDWISPVSLVFLVGLGVQPLFHQRMLLWWLVLLPWLVLPLWTSAYERVPYYWKMAPGVPSFRKTLLAGLLVVVVLLLSAPVQALLGGKPKPLAQGVSSGTPWQLAQELKQPGKANEAWQQALAKGLEAYPHQQFAGVIFASETLGDYFAWSLPRDRMPIYIDSHVHLFTAEHWQRAAIIKWARPGWKDMLDGGRVNLIVVEADLHPHLRDALKQDSDWTVLLDESGSTQKLLKCRFFVALRKQPLLK